MEAVLVLSSVLRSIEISAVSVKKCSNISLEKMIFNTTGLVYKRKCLNSVNFQRSASNSVLGWRANSDRNFSDGGRRLLYSCIVCNAEGLHSAGPCLKHHKIRSTTQRQTIRI